MLTIGVAVATAAPVAAHHSDAGLDMQSLVTLDGTVVEYNWRNPHVYIVVDSLDEQGRTVAPMRCSSRSRKKAVSRWARSFTLPRASRALRDPRSLRARRASMVSGSPMVTGWLTTPAVSTVSFEHS